MKIRGIINYVLRDEKCIQNTYKSNELHDFKNSAVSCTHAGADIIIIKNKHKFSETAKGWYWNMEKLDRKYAVKLHISYDSGCQPIHIT